MTADSKNPPKNLGEISQEIIQYISFEDDSPQYIHCVGVLHFVHEQDEE